ncbi:helix-turn-helix domain-containing protein [Yersinia pekkanenii]|uniref:Antitoxin HipB n=1 Tax=Yersinia pekkanenii TaxID=1288385 RepID=A0A0T9PEB8_9GAMM|nr:helix-turn-helix transcriptional regulator [Yersinia pekkanenii]CNH58855.1 antitoxin HipB [Yersinia pekkanenii]CRY66394.1 antitoxin HipB [Yersinia pekkanenii]
MKSLLDVAEQIKEIRQQKQFTQSDMRLINGMTQQQVSKFEKGGDIHLSTFLRILAGFDLEMLLLTREQAQDIGLTMGAERVVNKDDITVNDDPWTQKYKDLED